MLQGCFEATAPEQFVCFGAIQSRRMSVWSSRFDVVWNGSDNFVRRSETRRGRTRLHRETDSESYRKNGEHNDNQRKDSQARLGGPVQFRQVGCIIVIFRYFRHIELTLTKYPKPANMPRRSLRANPFPLILNVGTI